MATSAHLAHQLPGNESDLLALTRFWQWQRFVEEQLPTLLKRQSITTVFQTIFHITTEQPIPHGYEALTRFPFAPQIPVGLWFRTAHEIGLGHQLELTAAHEATAAANKLPQNSTIFINSSSGNARELAEHTVHGIEDQIVIDIPATALADPTCKTTVDHLHDAGIQIAIDNTPLDQLHELRSALLTVRPDYIKVDVLVGLSDNPMGRFNLADGATWCRDSDITLIAERVEKPQDLELLRHLGVSCAQGYSLAKPVRVPPTSS